MTTDNCIPGLVGSDHIGFTVPDMEQAHRFFTGILGCIHVYSLGPFPADPDLMVGRLNVDPAAVMEEIRFYRCHTGTNFEVFSYSAPNQRLSQPKNTDIGGHHIAFYVEDIDPAVDWLRSQDIQILGEPTDSSGASRGQRWVYFLSPWGMQFELVSYPDGKAYEPTATTLLWDPRVPSA